MLNKLKNLPKAGSYFLVHIKVFSNIIPQTHGSPKTPLPPTVYQLRGIDTPVNFSGRFIIAIAKKLKNALKKMDLIILWLFMCSTSNASVKTENHIIAKIPNAFIITPRINKYAG